MWEGAAALPGQFAASFDAARRLWGATDGIPAPARAADRAGVDVHAVAACGLGTGGAACEAVAALTAPRLEVPFWAGHSSEVPAFVDRHTLFFAVSASGATDETLAAASEADARGALVVGVGGDESSALARLADERGFVWFPLGGRGWRTVAALAAATMPLLVVLARVGLVPDAGPSVEAAASALARRRDALLASGGSAEVLARRIGRTIPLLYGAEGVAAVAADWWKTRVNLNAKAPAFAGALPTVTYGELAGWGQGGDVTRQTMSLVLLRHAGEGPRSAALFGSVRAATEEVMADVLEVWAEGADDLGRFFDLVLVGEVVSLHLAGREGVDPGPVPAVDDAHA